MLLARVARNALSIFPPRRKTPESKLHLKGKLIDGARLVIGSSNFEFVSLAAEEELMAEVSDSETIADFEARIVRPALQQALPDGAHRVGLLAGSAALVALKIAQGMAISARRARRSSIDWE